MNKNFMKKKILSVLLSAIMIVGMIPLSAVSAFAEENQRISVTYIDENGDEHTAENCIKMASSEAVDDFSFEAGEWYAVNGTYTVNNRIENNAPADNPAHLILGYGAVLNANMGIHNPEGKGLIIFTHSESVPGTLVADTGTKLDSFGHAQLGGLAALLAAEVKNDLNCKVRPIELSLLQRCASHCASYTDISEAKRAGFAAVEAAIEYEGPVYIRFGRAAVPVINDKPDYKFEIGKAVTMNDGKDVTIIACGLNVQMALKAADLLAAEGISARVIDMHTIIHSLTGRDIPSDVPNMMVTPRDIDRLTERASQLIAFGINLALQPSLSFEDVQGLF